MIETEALTKLYGDAVGIEDVTFSVEAGGVFGFLGPNGAGKTTTIRTLLDLLHPTRGGARIFGLDSQRDSVAIRARAGNLPGDFGYGKKATGREAIRLLARLRGIDGWGAPRPWPSASTPTSSARSVSSPAETGRRSDSSWRPFTRPSC